MVGEDGLEVVGGSGQSELNVGEAGGEVRREVVAPLAVSASAILTFGEEAAELDALDSSLMMEGAALRAIARKSAPSASAEPSLRETHLVLALARLPTSASLISTLQSCPLRPSRLGSGLCRNPRFPLLLLFGLCNGLLLGPRQANLLHWLLLCRFR